MNKVLSGELMPARKDIEHDFATLCSYSEEVASECTCGLHSPPVGLSNNPNAHIETCDFRLNRLRLAENINQSLLTRITNNDKD